MNPALDYARGRRALRPLLRSLTFVAELIAKPFRKAADFCDSPGPCNPRLGSVLQIAGVARQSRSATVCRPSPLCPPTSRPDNGKADKMIGGRQNGREGVRMMVIGYARVSTPD
jgi:hypothetical protein